MSTLPVTYSPPEVARRLGCKPERILGWIRSGKLQALNTSAGSKRPRFRVTPEALAAFERTLLVIPSKLQPRRRAAGRRKYFA